MDRAQYRESAVLKRAGFRHAFFTRSGGVSAGPYASLNFSTAVGDEPDNVRLNLERAAGTLGVPPGRIYYLSQVHGASAVTVDGSEDRERVLFTKGDAIVTTREGVACAVRVADCVPILVGDRASGAVAAIHAGWRGVVAGVLKSGVAELRRRAGAHGDLVAAVGPHISADAFEVSEEVAQRLLEASPERGVVDRTRGEKPHVDLRRIVRAQLRAEGLGETAIDDVPGCTVGDPELFSYRRDGKASGRHLAAIVARGVTGTRA